MTIEKIKAIENKREAAVIYAILLTAAVVFLFPIVWGLLASFRPPSQIRSAPGIIIPLSPTLENHINVWMGTPFDRWILNSLVISAGGVFITLFFDSLAGFTLAKGRFKGRRLLFLVIIGTLIIPSQAIVVPLYIVTQDLGLQNTYWGVIVVAVAGPFGTFMMRQFFTSISDDLIDSARMDGCSHWEIYTRIALPMSKPALSSLAVFLFIFSWGSFLWPLIILNDASMFPIQVGLGLLEGQYVSQIGQSIAAAVIAASPVFIAYLLAQRTFMEGITMGGAKG